MNRNQINLLYNLLDTYHCNSEIQHPNLTKYLDFILKNGYSYISKIPTKNIFLRRYTVFSKENGETTLKIYYFKQSDMLTDINQFTQKIELYKYLESINLSPKILNYGIVKYTKKISVLNKLLFGKKDKEIPSFGYIEYQNIGKNLYEILKTNMKVKELSFIAEKIYSLINSNIPHGNLNIKNIIYSNRKVYLINPNFKNKYYSTISILYSLYKYQKVIDPNNFSYLSKYFTSILIQNHNIPTYENMLEYYGKISMKTFFKILLKEKNL